MSKPLKKLDERQIACLIRDAEKLHDKVQTVAEPWEGIGYTRASIAILIKQLKGEYPII